MCHLFSLGIVQVGMITRNHSYYVFLTTSDSIVGDVFNMKNTRLKDIESVFGII